MKIIRRKFNRIYDVKTGIQTFPDAKAMFIDDIHYVVAVDIDRAVLKTPFVILKDMVLSAFCYVLVKEDLITKRLEYCFDNTKQNCKTYIKSLTEEQLLNMYNNRIYAYDIRTVTLFI